MVGFVGAVVFFVEEVVFFVDEVVFFVDEVVLPSTGLVVLPSFGLPVLPVGRTVLYLSLFALSIAIVFRGIPYWVGLVIIPLVLLFVEIGRWMPSQPNF